MGARSASSSSAAWTRRERLSDLLAPCTCLLELSDSFLDISPSAAASSVVPPSPSQPSRRATISSLVAIQSAWSRTAAARPRSSFTETCWRVPVPCGALQHGGLAAAHRFQAPGARQCLSERRCRGAQSSDEIAERGRIGGTVASMFLREAPRSGLVRRFSPHRARRQASRPGRSCHGSRIGRRRYR